jgi:RNA polymerase sigma-70 factor, ECF subfamily
VPDTSSGNPTVPPSNAALSGLLVAARDGRPSDVWALLDLYRGYLTRLAAARIPPGLRAKAGPSDLVQDTLLEAHRDLAGFRGQTEAEWLGWLRRILLHNLGNFERRYFGTVMRQAGRETSLADAPTAAAVADPGPSPSSVLVARERQAGVDAVLDRLPADYRDVVVWHHRHGLSFDEIGRRLGRTADAARRLWTRAIDRLQQHLTDATQ